jgi:ribosomal protein S18 acetylase RimI-like enzyme
MHVPSPLRIEVRRATSADVPALAMLAATTFREAYAGYCPPEDLESYVTTEFAVQRMVTDVSDPARVFLVAEADGELDAYALLHEDAVPACVTDPAPVLLSRLYVRQSRRGGGLGRLLVEQCAAVASGRGFRSLWLGVLEQNTAARTFYDRLGFREVGRGMFWMGRSRLADRILVRPIEE